MTTGISRVALMWVLSISSIAVAADETNAPPPVQPETRTAPAATSETQPPIAETQPATMPRGAAGSFDATPPIASPEPTTSPSETQPAPAETRPATAEGPAETRPAVTQGIPTSAEAPHTTSPEAAHPTSEPAGIAHHTHEGSADLAPHPILRDPNQRMGHWPVGMLVIAATLFLLAALVGPWVRYHAPEEVPPAHSHDEPPGASHHHGKSGTLNPEPDHGGGRH